MAETEKPETQMVLFKPSLLSHIYKPGISHFFSGIGRNIELRNGEEVSPCLLAMAQKQNGTA